MGQPFDLVDVVVGGQFARSGAREIGDGFNVRQLGRVKVRIDRLAVLIKRESGMRLIVDTGTDADLVDTVCDVTGWRIGR